MKSPIRSTLLAVLATAGLGLSSGAFAQGSSTYQSERAVCGHNQQDKAACLREAGAAQDAARRGQLTDPPPDQLVRNALARCDNQPEAERRACQDRVRGSGQTAIDGSVMGGGVLRETVTPIPSGMAPIPTSTSTLPRATLPSSSPPMPDATRVPPATMPRSTLPDTMPAMPSTLPPPAATMPPPAALPPR